MFPVVEEHQQVLLLLKTVTSLFHFRSWKSGTSELFFPAVSELKSTGLQSALVFS